jgi:hypothetical protein
MYHLIRAFEDKRKFVFCLDDLRKYSFGKLLKTNAGALFLPQTNFALGCWGGACGRTGNDFIGIKMIDTCMSCENFLGAAGLQL